MRTEQKVWLHVYAAAILGMSSRDGYRLPEAETSIARRQAKAAVEHFREVFAAASAVDTYDSPAEEARTSEEEINHED